MGSRDEGLVSCDTFVIVGKEGVSETNLKDLNVANQTNTLSSALFLMDITQLSVNKGVRSR